MEPTDLLEVCDVAEALTEHGYPISQDEFDYILRRGTGPLVVVMGGKRVTRWMDVIAWLDARPPAVEPSAVPAAPVHAEHTDKEYLADVLASYLLQHHPSIWKRLCAIEGRPRRDKINEMTREVIDTMLRYARRLPININQDFTN